MKTSIAQGTAREDRTHLVLDAAPFLYIVPPARRTRTMSEQPQLNTGQKALQINLDARLYGTFAEIGGGQEAGRWFFRVGGAAGTVAKTISAYDMAVSDAIYGTAERYVSRQRLQAMLDYEWNLLLQRLDKTRGDKTAFFVFANTVATHSFSRQGRGTWLDRRPLSNPAARAVVGNHHSCADARPRKRPRTGGARHDRRQSDLRRMLSPQRAGQAHQLAAWTASRANASRWT